MKQLSPVSADDTQSTPLVILTVPHAATNSLSKEQSSDSAALTIATQIKLKLQTLFKTKIDVALLPGTTNGSTVDLNHYRRPAEPNYAEWKTYHDNLDSLISDNHARRLVLVDVHSYAATAGNSNQPSGYTVAGSLDKAFGSFLNDKLWGKDQPLAPSGENAVILRASDQLVRDAALVAMREPDKATFATTIDRVSTSVSEAIVEWLSLHSEDDRVERSSRIKWIQSLSNTNFVVREAKDADQAIYKPVPSTYAEELKYRQQQCRIDRDPSVILYNTFTIGSSVLVIVRDDLLCGGAKSRYLPYVLSDPAYKRYREFIYASGWPGGAQASLAASIKHMNTKRVGEDRLQATIFIEPDDSNPRLIPQKPFPLVARGAGAQYKLVPNGTDMASSVVNYVAKDTTNRRKVLESGIPSPVERMIIRRMAECVRDHFQLKKGDVPFDEVWVCVGSAVFIHGLAQVTDLAKKFIGVSVYSGAVYPTIANVEIQHANKDVYVPIDPKTDPMPPVPSSLNYDAKVWANLRQTFNSKIQKRVLWWNMF